MVSPVALCVVSPQQICGNQLSTDRHGWQWQWDSRKHQYVKSNGLWATALASKEFIFFLGKTDAYIVVILWKQVQNAVGALKAELPLWIGGR